MHSVIYKSIVEEQMFFVEIHKRNYIQIMTLFSPWFHPHPHIWENYMYEVYCYNINTKPIRFFFMIAKDVFFLISERWFILFLAVDFSCCSYIKYYYGSQQIFREVLRKNGEIVFIWRVAFWSRIYCIYR